MSVERVYRSAIVGCGPMGRWHAKTYKLISRGELVACCDLDAERRQSYAEEFGITPYAEADDMITREKPDLVHVVTPPNVRVGLMQTISDNSAPACIVEKPIACEVSDWKKLCEFEGKTKTKFAVCHQFRWHLNLARCREALNSGKLGKLLFLDFSAGMNISGQGTHILDWAMSLNQDAPVVRVFGATSGTGGIMGYHPGPDTTVAQIVFANGVCGMWNNGFTAPRTVNDNADYKHCRIAAYAERGRTLWEEFGKWEIASSDGLEAGKSADIKEHEEQNHAAQAGLINAMFDWLEDDSKPAGTNLKRALYQWNVVLGLYASSLLRKPIDIPFDPPDDLFLKLAEALK